MDPRSGDKAPEKGCLTPLSEHPDMDRLAEILRGLPPDRQDAFMEALSQDETQRRGTVIPLDREDKCPTRGTILEDETNEPRPERDDYTPA